VHEQQKDDSQLEFGPTTVDRRVARLRAVARELKRIGYIVIVNASNTGMVVIQREDDHHGDI
jgi:hypothetical protein